jgi:hypothetical protein
MSTSLLIISTYNISQSTNSSAILSTSRPRLRS